MSKTLWISAALLLGAFAVAAQDTKTAAKSASKTLFSVPVEAARKENPVKPTPESLARGKKQYGYDCAMCHGKDGVGKGDVAVDMKLNMHDDSDAATLKDRTDGELFYIIKNGKDQMPPEGNRVKDETIWDMVNYIRSLAKKGEAEKPAEQKAPEAKPTDEKPAGEKPSGPTK
ncbi:MAG TPA: c-type cytochrome [Terriglobales bacterium]|nr:c-type cytochrome [Terriglobales bacterium]